jgi:hypothetical protein
MRFPNSPSCLSFCNTQHRVCRSVVEGRRSDVEQEEGLAARFDRRRLDVQLLESLREAEPKLSLRPLEVRHEPVEESASSGGWSGGRAVTASHARTSMPTSAIGQHGPEPHRRARDMWITAGTP